MSATDTASPNTARFDWRLLPLIVVGGAGLVAWGELNAGQRQIDRRVGALEEQQAAKQAADTRVLERLVTIEVRLDELKRLLGGRAEAGR